MSERNICEVSNMRHTQVCVGLESQTGDPTPRLASLKSLRRAGVAFRLDDPNDTEAMQTLLNRVGDRSVRDIRILSTENVFGVVDPVPYNLVYKLYTEPVER